MLILKLFSLDLEMLVRLHEHVYIAIYKETSFLDVI